MLDLASPQPKVEPPIRIVKSYLGFYAQELRAQVHIRPFGELKTKVYFAPLRAVKYSPIVPTSCGAGRGRWRSRHLPRRNRHRMPTRPPLHSESSHAPLTTIDGDQV